MSDYMALDSDELEKAVEKVTSSSEWCRCSEWCRWLTDRLIERGFDFIGNMIGEQLEEGDN